jgi:two-component system OmpR family response regulator
VRILVLEDDEPIAQLVLTLLAEEGYEPVRVATHAQALELLATGPWHAVVADGSGPAYDEVDPRDRALFAALGRLAPVIVTTARSWAGHVDPTELGVRAVLAKPYDLEDLLLLLRAL